VGTESSTDSTYALVARQVGDPVVSTFYLRLTGGFVTTKDSSDNGEDIEFDEGWLASVGIGDRVASLTRDWTDQDTDQDGVLGPNVTDVNVGAVLLNGLLDFPLIRDTLSIYGGAGIGVSWLQIDGSGFDEDDGPFLSWQAKAGLAWRFTPSTAVHIGYRLLNVDNAELDDNASAASFDIETRQHSLEAGLLFGI
jgi:opacity protein-like surface antigen